MLTKLFFGTGAGVRVERVWWEGACLHLAARATRRVACCPLCGYRSKRVHSCYGRTLADMPCGGARVTVHVGTRRFLCRRPGCPRTIFTERLPAVMAPSARHTTRLGEQFQRTGFALGGAPGARYATASGMPVSRRTLLRLVRAAPLPEVGQVRVVGVDDWAQCKGRVYGTIVVNLETRTVIAVLPDRTAATVAAWLADHPEIEVVSRDRAGAYAEGARQGAPQARQVADRFHLVKNVTDALERFLTRKHHALRQATLPQSEQGHAPLPDAPPAVEDAETPAVLTRGEREQQARRARRQARSEEVRALHAQGASSRAIAHQVGLGRHTVQRILRAEGGPERASPARRATLLTPYESYLRARWTAGCHNTATLWQEIQAQGFPGGASHVRHHLAAWRTGPRRGAGHRTDSAPGLPPPATRTYSARQTVWLLLRSVADLSAEDQTYLTQLAHTCPLITLAQALVQEFRTVLREQDVAGLYAWLRGMTMCPIPEFCAVATSLWQDRRALEAAVSLIWSNGPVEGHVNKVKVLKRSMYGRAKLDLLRQRLLHVA